MNTSQNNEQLVLPNFSEKDIEALKKYFEFSDQYREKMNLELAEKLRNHPLWGPMIKQMPEEQRKTQDERSYTLQKAAIYEGKWEDYARDLLAQGRVYARMNINYNEWYELVRLAKVMLIPYIKKDFKNSFEDAIDVIDGLSKLVDYAMYGIAVAYFMEKNELIRTEQERFKLIFNASDDIILLVEKDGNIQAINHAGNYDPAELIGKKIYEFQGEDNAIKIEEAVKNAMDTRHPTTFEIGAQINNDYKYYSGKVSPVFNDDNEVNSVVVISRDITKQKTIENELVEINATLEQKIIARTEELNIINKELESFTYSVSHDLRAPLRAINGFSEILKEEFADIINESAEDALNEIIINVKKMGQLIDSLLEFSRLGKQNVTFALVDMQELFKYTCEDMQRFSEKKATINIHELSPAYGDLAMLKLVANNLISNAIKYSSGKTDPIIDISSVANGNHVTYSIRDNGAGFNMAYYDKLFNVFQRLHGSDEFEGTGVGLAIVQRIITKHNGKIWAEGKENEGATFHFSLPKSINTYI